MALKQNGGTEGEQNSSYSCLSFHDSRQWDEGGSSAGYRTFSLGKGSKSYISVPEPFGFLDTWLILPVTYACLKD